MSDYKSRGQAIFDNVVVGVILLLIASVVAAFFGFGPDKMTQDFRFTYVLVAVTITAFILIIYVIIKFARSVFDGEGSGFGTFVYNVFAVCCIIVVIVAAVYFTPPAFRALRSFVADYIYSH